VPYRIHKLSFLQALVSILNHLANALNLPNPELVDRLASLARILDSLLD
jgi:hypothetical protein